MNKGISFMSIIIMCSLLLCSCRDEMDPGSANTIAGLLSLLIEFFSVILTALFGGMFAILGFWLTYKGYTGEIGLLMSGDGIEARLINASPGIVLIVLGFLLIWKSRANIRIK